MKALTLWQPWAWAIVAAGKNVENRTWEPPRDIIGERIAIHAGKTIDIESILAMRNEMRINCPSPASLVRGAIVGTARVVGAIAVNGGTCQYNGGVTLEQSSVLCDSHWFSGPIGWVLADVVRFHEPIQCRGAQGLWELGPAYERLVLEEEKYGVPT